MSKSLKDVLDEYFKENPKSPVTVTTARCSVCDTEFESYALSINGEEIIGCGMCAICTETYRREFLLCKSCGGTKHAAMIMPSITPVLRCPKCDFNELRDFSEKNRRARRIEEVIPLEYRFHNLDLIPCKIPFQNLLDWNYGRTGVYLTGPHGMGKTRGLYALTKKVILGEGRSAAAYSGTRFSDECSKRFGRDEMNGQDWIYFLCNVDLFFLNDLGKGKITERVQSELFEVIDVRISNGKPTFVDSNEGYFTGSNEHSLVAKFPDPQVGKAILTRLENPLYFQQIVFQK